MTQTFAQWQAQKAATAAAEPKDDPVEVATPEAWKQPRTHIRQRPPVRAPHK